MTHFRQTSFVRHKDNKALKTEIARQFRKEPTPSEEQVWSMLRNRQVLGLKWRRQKVINGFVADFYCAEHHIVLEIDGTIHDCEDTKMYDRAREQIFAEIGITTIRIKNSECNINFITESIKKHL